MVYIYEWSLFWFFVVSTLGTVSGVTGVCFLSWLLWRWFVMCINYFELLYIKL